MRATDYGPVPVSRMKSEVAAIFEALSRGRAVLISKHGRVVATIDPPEAIPREILVDYVTPGHRVLPELTASHINQGSPSAAVTASVEGSTYYVTKNNQVYGLLRSMSDGDLAVHLPSREQVAQRERRIEQFLEQNPDADAEQVASLGEELDRELGIATAAWSPGPDQQSGVGSSAEDASAQSKDASAVRSRAKNAPMAAGLAALGAGLLAAVVLPPTDTERKAAERARSSLVPLKEHAAQLSRELADEFKETAQNSVEQQRKRSDGGSERTKQDSDPSRVEAKQNAQEAIRAVKGAVRPRRAGARRPPTSSGTPKRRTQKVAQRSELVRG